MTKMSQVDSFNVEGEDHEQVMMRIYGAGKNTVKLLVEYDEGQ